MKLPAGAGGDQLVRDRRKKECLAGAGESESPQGLAGCAAQPIRISFSSQARQVLIKSPSILAYHKPRPLV